MRRRRRAHDAELADDDIYFDTCDECDENVDHVCDLCGCCEDCCDCADDLFDADELGLDPEDDDLRRYRIPRIA